MARHRSMFTLSLLLALAVSAAPAQAARYKGGEVAEGGSVAGELFYSGKPLAPPQMKVTKDHGVCGSTKHSEALIVGSKGALKNGVVYIKKIRSGKPLVKSTVVLDQKGCVYLPHVQAATKGSKIELRNNDAILHNVHAVVGKDIVFNVAMPMKGQRIKQKLRHAKLVTITCDAGHTWMSSYVQVFDHPYFAVTDADGRFKIDDIPPGTYTLVAWHETLGVQEKSVTVSPTGQLSTNFDWK